MIMQILCPLHRTLTKQWKNQLKDLEKVQLIIKINIRLKVCLSLKVCMAYRSGISFLGSVFNTSSTMTGPSASCKNHNFFCSFLRQILFSFACIFSSTDTSVSLLSFFCELHRCCQALNLFFCHVGLFLLKATFFFCFPDFLTIRYLSLELPVWDPTSL